MARSQAGARSADDADDPPTDPTAVEEAYRFHRARRRVRVERHRRTRYAQLRFYATLTALVFVVVLVSLTVWNELQRLFGL